MAKINVLPREVAELIAAGEVIERPASIVKELVENSIDAGANDITVEIQYGGVRYIRVTDNGCGIAPSDAPTAFLRHATSKVSVASDLDSIGTLGFRGEALASIAAVAHVDMLTKTCDDAVGTLVKISGSEVTEVSEAGCPNGTTIVIRDVFYNVPARLKFLKKDITESNAVASIVDKIALSHPEISFSFIRDGKQSYRTPGNGDLLGTIYTVLGRDFAGTMLPVDYASGPIHISGYIGRPMAARSNRAMQHFFVNGRYTRTRTCGVALEEGYRGAMMVGKFPSCVLMLELPCDQVDVNVHPAKIEVRFVSEKAVFDAVYFAVKSTLATDGELSDSGKRHKGNLLTPFSDPDASEQMPLDVHETPGKNTSKKETFSVMSAGEYRELNHLPPSPHEAEVHEAPEPGARVQLREEWLPRRGSEAQLDVEPDPADFDDLPGRVSGKDKSDSLKLSELKAASAASAAAQPAAAVRPAAYPIGNSTGIGSSIGFASPSGYTTGTAFSSEDFDAAKEEPIAEPSTDEPEYELYGEIFSTYIICRIGEELVLIDKHAAHERIIYNRLKSQGETLERQLLLTPAVISLSREEHTLALEKREVLLKLGFETDDFGGNTVVLRSVPALMAGESPRELLLDALEELSRSRAGITAADDILHRMACRSAIKGGDHNTPEELTEVIRTIIRDENVRYCPHGRPVMIRYTKRQLEKMFGRIQ